MPSIISYRKYVDALITRELRLPENDNHQRIGQELATIDGVTYVALPDGAVLPGNQPAEIVGSIDTETLTDALRDQIKAASPIVRMINTQVSGRIAERYSVSDEIKLLRTAPSAEFEVYNAFAEDCRAWGREQKSAIGL